MTKRTMIPLAAAALALAPAALAAPRPVPGRAPSSVDELADRCHASGLEGWELVDEATQQVHDAFDHVSLWHLWESSGTALAHGHGWSAQYNGALMQVLRRLGLQAEAVHAARVHGLGHNPWWHAGHTWLRVSHEGRTLDVCASLPGNTAGHVAFRPVTEVRPMNRWTRAVVSLAMAPVVTVQAWRHVAGAPVPRWLYREFGDRP